MDVIPTPTTRALRESRPHGLRPETDEPFGFHFELEPDGRGNQVPTLTYFLTGSECRFTCAFCDLWKFTLERETSPGSLPRQIHTLHERTRTLSPRPKWLKLYNASNFFDPKNVPVEDLPQIAEACRGFDCVIVENHAALIESSSCRQRILEFADAIEGRLEIALGLETTHAATIALTNKRLTLPQFQSACAFLLENHISIRTFVLLQPPGTGPHDAVDRAFESLQFAFESGVRHCSILPTRAGNGWLDQLEKNRLWSPPDIATIEALMQRALQFDRAEGKVVTIDLWDWDRVAGGCGTCRPSRYDTLVAMNASQSPIPRPSCLVCDAVREPQRGNVH